MSQKNAQDELDKKIKQRKVVEDSPGYKLGSSGTHKTILEIDKRISELKDIIDNYNAPSKSVQNTRDW